jgi:hypothetical protein
MRRVVLTIVGTVAGLVVLLTFKSHTGTSAVSAAPAGTAGLGGTAGTSSGAGTTNGAGGTAPSRAASGTSGGGSAPSGSSASPATAPGQGDTAGARIITGNVAILQQPSTTAHDLQIGAFAFPQLEAETLSAQSAKIDMVSGATYTSGGYIQSLQSAIDRGA